MVRVVDCHAGVLGLNPGGPKDFSIWNCFRILPQSWFYCHFVFSVKSDCIHVMGAQPSLLCYVIHPSKCVLSFDWSR